MQYMIKSRREGFRRCGVVWPKGPTVFDECRFSPEEWAVLKGEPNLTVAEIPEPEPAESPEAESGTPEPENPETGVEAAQAKAGTPAPEKPPKVRKIRE